MTCILSQVGNIVNNIIWCIMSSVVRGIVVWLIHSTWANIKRIKARLLMSCLTEIWRGTRHFFYSYCFKHCSKIQFGRESVLFINFQSFLHFPECLNIFIGIWYSFQIIFLLLLEIFLNWCTWKTFAVPNEYISWGVINIEWLNIGYYLHTMIIWICLNRRIHLTTLIVWVRM